MTSKLVHIWSVEPIFDQKIISSNLMALEWEIRGHWNFPLIDAIGWGIPDCLTSVKLYWITSGESTMKPLFLIPLGRFNDFWRLTSSSLSQFLMFPSENNPRSLYTNLKNTDSVEVRVRVQTWRTPSYNLYYSQLVLTFNLLDVGWKHIVICELSVSSSDCLFYSDHALFSSFVDLFFAQWANPFCCFISYKLYE